MDAWRFEKLLTPELTPEIARVPYYRQTLDFTCGAAALMMAMKSLTPALVLDRRLELRLWREATTIFMTSGHGGCGPFGVALAAARRRFRVEVHVSDSGVHLVDSVRSAQKKEVMRLVQQDQEEQLQARGVPIHYSRLTLAELEERFRNGAIPIVLISFYAIYGERIPHWVVITGFDEHFVYVHDPYVDDEGGETLADSIHMPIARRQFAQMARYGRAGLQAAVLVHAPEPAAAAE